MWGYLPNFATILLAVLQLAKDWGAHQTHSRRALVLLAILFLGIGGAFNTYFSGKRAASQHIEDQKQISGLQKAVETTDKNQEANTKQFINSFQGLSQKLSGLEVQLKTAGLQQQAAQLKRELEATQRALTPAKAEIESSLGEVSETLDNLNVKEVAVTPSASGTLDFRIAVINKSEVQAKNGSIFLRICNMCEYAEEPVRFVRAIGSPSSDREMVFQAISAKGGVAIPLKIKPPPELHRFEVDVIVKCENCEGAPKEVLHVNY